MEIRSRVIVRDIPREMIILLFHLRHLYLRGIKISY